MECFKEVMKEAGISLSSEDTPNTIIQEQSLVIRDVEKSLKSHPNFPENVKTFTSGLKIHCENELNYIKALKPVTLVKEELSLQQDSLFRLLLHVDSLQTNLIEILLQQLEEHASEDNVELNWIQLILNALRYLPFLNKPQVLTDKLLDIIEITTFDSQMTILNVLFEIIPDSQHDEAGKLLSRILEDNENLAGSIIDCLNFFCLSDDARINIQEYISKRLLMNARYFKIFPILFEFLVNSKKEYLPELLLKLRDTLDLIMSSDGDELLSTKVVIFQKLQSLLCTSKYLFEVTVNLVNNIKVAGEHKGIDVVLLFAMHSTCRTKKRIIDGVFKKRIKGGFFKRELIQKVFEVYFTKKIFGDYFGSIIKISGMLLMSYNEPSMVEMGSLLFRLTFLNTLTSKKQRQEVIYNLMLLMRSNDSKNASKILLIFESLLPEAALKDHLVQLMGLLEVLKYFDCANVKKLFEILCCLTVQADEAYSGLKDDLHMLIRKELSHFEKNAKRRGIFGAIAMIKFIVSTEEEQDSVIEATDESIMNVSDLPDKSKEAANLLEMVLKCCKTPEMLGLCYDEISEMIIKTTHIDRNFLHWFAEIKTAEFQNVFVVENYPKEIDGIELSSKYSLNAQDEVAAEISINIAGLTLHNRKGEILILPSVFRLVRLLQYKQANGDLSSIDALIGCGVIMPNFENPYEPEKQKLIADCVYHCINWFREVISAFSTQNFRKVRSKVLTRLTNLIELEEQFYDLISEIPNHKPPEAYFNSQHESPKKTQGPPVKRFKSAAVVNETTASTSTQVKSTTTVKNLDHLNFRQFDTDVIILLKYPLDISDDVTTQSQLLTIKQFQFILKEFVEKFKPKFNINIPDLITDALKLLPNIHKQFKLITNNLNNVQDFNETSTDLKLTFHLILELYMAIFTWKGFEHKTNSKLLSDCLKTFQIATVQSQSQLIITLNRLVTEFINNLFTYTEQCLHLPSAVCIIRIMQSLHKITQMPETNKIIFKASEKLLKKRWHNLQGKVEIGKAAHENIDVIIKSYLSDAKVATLCEIVGELQDDIKDLKARDSLTMLTAIDKNNFYIFYRNLCTALSERVKLEVEGLTNNEHLTLWRTTALIMQGLMMIAKVQESRNNFSVFLKKCINILKVFLSHGIPIMEITLRSNPDEVLEIFKTMQTSTRFLHHLCCHSKAIKDGSIMAAVPKFREVLETLIYRVKAALVANNCTQAFWMGNLRNRDLQGEDILTQSTASSVTDQSEELPMEESEDEETKSESAANTSASDVFEMDE